MSYVFFNSAEGDMLEFTQESGPAFKMGGKDDFNGPPGAKATPTRPPVISLDSDDEEGKIHLVWIFFCVVPGFVVC
jgi:hypothetical protein